MKLLEIKPEDVAACVAARLTKVDLLKPLRNYDRKTPLPAGLINEEYPGIRVEFRMLKLKDYMDWLTREHLDNKPENRARFIAS